MNLSGPYALLAQANPATQDPKAQLLFQVGLMAFIGIVFYMILIRPQQKKQKEHAQLLKSIKPGDKIVTSGGIIGVIVTVKEKTATLRSADAKFEISKGAIAEITERSGEVSPS